MSNKVLDVLTVVHMGNYDKDGKIINDSCPCCDWAPPQNKLTEMINKLTSHSDDPEWYLGMIWNPGIERGIGAYFQVIHCQKCGLVYATHVN